MATGTAILQACREALIEKTDAQARVFSPMDIPTSGPDYPALIVQMDDESGESWGNVGGPAFTVTATLRITGRVASPADADDDAGAAVSYSKLGTLADQIKAAIFGAPLLGPLGPIQEFAAFRTKKNLSDAAADRHYGAVVVEIDIVFQQDLRDFLATGEDGKSDGNLPPLENVHVTTGAPAQTATVQVDTYNLNA